MIEKPLLIPSERIESAIMVFRGHKVMLDSDLADLYGIETKTLVRAMKRNIERFPEDFMFQLSNQEFRNLKYQFGTSSKDHGGRRSNPYVFTEHGILMLSSVLRSERAVQVNIGIMRAFVRMREIMASTQELSKRLDALERKYDAQFKVVFNSIRELIEARPKELPSVPSKKRPIGFGRN